MAKRVQPRSKSATRDGNRAGTQEVGAAAELSYAYPPDRIGTGHSLGNAYCYVTLDGKTDVLSEPTSVRFGLRESTNQKYYLLGWELSVAAEGGKLLEAVSTRFSPAEQVSQLEADGCKVQKRFFVPVEIDYLRSAHFVLNEATRTRLSIRSRVQLPEGARASQVDYKGHSYVLIRYPDDTAGILWGSGSLRSFKVRDADVEAKAVDLFMRPTSETIRRRYVEVEIELDWEPMDQEPEYALSYAYAVYGGEAATPTLLNAVFDLWNAQSPSFAAHRLRIVTLFENSVAAVDRYLEACGLWTPDPAINRAYAWAKVNQLRMQQEYKWGSGFSNNPPTDIVVGRDSFWYLAGSNYYAQPWSRKLLDLWFLVGLELNGKFTEYFHASREPIFRDDYGLNVNDNTPLMVLSACQYYALSGDLGFLHAVYSSLLNSANYILSQSKISGQNRYGLVWCNSTETFVRGLCGWRNAIANYNLSGAVTEVNSACFQMLLHVAQLAGALGDEPNRRRLEAAAKDLRRKINQHLRSQAGSNPYYYLNINPAGEPVGDMTADLVFPVLFGVADEATGKNILRELFSERFWVGEKGGPGGIRTVSSAEPSCNPRADLATWGLMGGLWPNITLWASKAAASCGLPELALQGLRSTFLLCEQSDPRAYNVVPGEFPEYFNADDLIQTGMPLSPFVPGIFIWAALEGLVGIAAEADSLAVNPVLPKAWGWLGVSRMPYRGRPVSFLAVEKERKLYTTARLKSKWKQVVVPESLQENFTFVSDQPAFWMVVPGSKGNEVIAASAYRATGKLLEAASGRVVAELELAPGGIQRKALR